MSSEPSEAASEHVTTICRICGAPGILAQGPWPVPISDAFCDTCFELERIAWWVWRRLNPGKAKIEAPIPFMKSKDDYPPDVFNKSVLEIETYFRSVFLHNSCE